MIMNRKSDTHKENNNFMIKVTKKIDTDSPKKESEWKLAALILPDHISLFKDLIPSNLSTSYCPLL